MRYIRDVFDGVILAPLGEMGELSISRAGLAHRFRPISYKPSYPSTREDTIKSAKEMSELGVDLLLFAGGDGTAKDLYEAVDASLVVLGIPSGVKVFSSVFAETPEDAGRVLLEFLEGSTETTYGEVIDISELDYRRGVFSPRVVGTMKIPSSPLIQRGKDLPEIDEVVLDGIFRYIKDRVSNYEIVVLGPGRTVSYIAKKMGIEKNPATVDAIVKGVVHRDVNYFQMRDILDHTPGRVLVVLSPIGGTGFLLGRGNHQLIPAVRRAKWDEDIIVISTPEKIRGLRSLIVDVDEFLGDIPSYIRVITGYRDEKIMRIWFSGQYHERTID